jgi:hypothetical protein
LDGLFEERVGSQIACCLVEGWRIAGLKIDKILLLQLNILLNIFDF